MESLSQLSLSIFKGQITYRLSDAFYKWRLSLLSLTLLKPVLMLQKVQVYSLRCTVANHCVHIEKDSGYLVQTHYKK